MAKEDRFLVQPSLLEPRAEPEQVSAHGHEVRVPLDALSGSRVLVKAFVFYK